jgi:hypothetical protein
MRSRVDLPRRCQIHAYAGGGDAGKDCGGVPALGQLVVMRHEICWIRTKSYKNVDRCPPKRWIVAPSI